jgi:hypothetical protein
VYVPQAQSKEICMLFHARLKLRTAISQTVVLIASSLLLAPISSAMGLGQERQALPEAIIGLEISLGSRSRSIRLAGPGGRPSGTFIPRQGLTINDSQADTEFTGISLETEMEGDGIRVSISLIYSDLSNSEDKKAKAAGSYLLWTGESIRLK